MCTGINNLQHGGSGGQLLLLVVWSTKGKTEARVLVAVRSHPKIGGEILEPLS